MYRQDAGVSFAGQISRQGRLQGRPLFLVLQARMLRAAALCSESERLVRGNAMLDVVVMPGACDQLLIQAGAAEPKSK
jgi:hypothetical protein